MKITIRLLFVITLYFLTDPVFGQSSHNTVINFDTIHSAPRFQIIGQRVIFIRQQNNDSIRFNYETTFSFVNFVSQVPFNLAKFNKDAYFQYTHFLKTASFSGDVFLKNLNMYHAEFEKPVTFWGTNFGAEVIFADAKFKCVTRFSHITTSAATHFDFGSAMLPPLLDFSNNIDLQHVVDFTVADFSKHKLYGDSARSWHYINLCNSDIQNIKLDYEHFRLCFYSTKVDDSSAPVKLLINGKGDTLYFDQKYSAADSLFYIKLLKEPVVIDYLHQVFPSAKLTDPVVKIFLKNCLTNNYFPTLLHDDEIYSTYEKVLKNFESSGQKLSYQTLDIEYRDFKDGPRSLGHLWYCYGYHKEWIFYWTAGFVLFFTMITTFLIGKLNRSVLSGGTYYVANIPDDLQTTPWYKRFWYSLMYTSTIFFLLTLKTENLNFKNKAGVAYVMLIYSVGLLCLGYMANFVLQK